MGVEHRGDGAGGCRSVFGATHGGTAHLSDYNFENIIVEGPVFRGFGICVEKSKFGIADSGTITGASPQNRMKGHVSSVAFHNLTLQGTTITSAKQGHFDLDATTSGITFDASNAFIV